MALITASFFEARFGRSLNGTETTQVEAFIDDASELVLDIGDRDWTSGTVPAVVKGVVYHLVRRTFTNPESMASEQIGDYRYQRAEGTENAMLLTDKEEEVVRRAAGRANVSTVGLRRPNAYERQYVTDDLQEDDLTL